MLQAFALSRIERATPTFTHFSEGRGGLCHLAFFPVEHPESIYSFYQSLILQETLVGGEKINTAHAQVWFCCWLLRVSAAFVVFLKSSPAEINQYLVEILSSNFWWKKTMLATWFAFCCNTFRSLGCSSHTGRFALSSSRPLCRGFCSFALLFALFFLLLWLRFPLSWVYFCVHVELHTK